MPLVGHALLRQRLSALDADIAYHESILLDLKQQRSFVHSELQSIVYPVLTLPPEIVAEIFKWCGAEGMAPNSSCAPLLLTQICRDWRTLAFSTPALWDTLHELDFELYASAEAAIDWWFSHAGSRPLSLMAIADCEISSAALRSVMVRHGLRLLYLRLIVSEEGVVNFASIDSFPMLRHLDLAGNIKYRGAADDPVLIIHNAPALRRLSLSDVRPSMTQLPWFQLEELELRYIPL
ncbi:hypothetical protein FB45DRAFT_843054, partial [Roridomyces roridus]